MAKITLCCVQCTWTAVNRRSEVPPIVTSFDRYAMTTWRRATTTSAGDYYIVQSDSWHGKEDPWHGSSHLARRPAECALAFNFGDRLASMSVDEWWCHLRDVHDPFLAIYNNCEGQRDKLLVSWSILQLRSVNEAVVRRPF